MTNIEINIMLFFKRHKRSKISSYYTMPSSQIFLHEFFFYIASYFFFIITFIDCYLLILVNYKYPYMLLLLLLVPSLYSSLNALKIIFDIFFVLVYIINAINKDAYKLILIILYGLILIKYLSFSK